MLFLFTFHVHSSCSSFLETYRLVNAHQIKSLYFRFQDLDRSETGTITYSANFILDKCRVDDFMKIPELAINPLSERLIKLFQCDNTDDANVNFSQFVRTLSHLAPIPERRPHEKLTDEQLLALKKERTERGVPSTH